MIIVLTTVGLTLLTIFIIAGLICLFNLYGKLNKLSKGYEDLKRYAENSADEIYRSFDQRDSEDKIELGGRIDSVSRDLEEVQRLLDGRIDDVVRALDSRYDQLLNRVEKEYVRLPTSK